MVERAGDAPPPLILASVPAPYGMGGKAARGLSAKGGDPGNPHGLPSVSALCGKPVYPDSARGRDQGFGMGPDELQGSREQQKRSQEVKDGNTRKIPIALILHP